MTGNATTAAAIYGAGGHARVVASILAARGQQVLGCFDDSYCGVPEKILQARLLGTFHDILDHRGAIGAVYLAIGNNAEREQAWRFLTGHGFPLPPLVHPNATLEAGVELGQGTVVCTGAILGVQVQVGEAALIDTGVVVDHESRVGSFSHLAPRVCVAGRTRIGSRCFVGMNATIADGLNVGAGATIGAGSVVLQDVAGRDKVVGVHR